MTLCLMHEERDESSDTVNYRLWELSDLSTQFTQGTKFLGLHVLKVSLLHFEVKFLFFYHRKNVMSHNLAGQE